MTPTNEGATSGEADEPVAWRDPECPRHVISSGDKRDAAEDRNRNTVLRLIADRCSEPLYTRPAAVAASPKLDNLLEMVRVWVERDDGDMDALLSWMYGSPQGAAAPDGALTDEKLDELEDHFMVRRECSAGGHCHLIADVQGFARAIESEVRASLTQGASHD